MNKKEVKMKIFIYFLMGGVILHTLLRCIELGRNTAVLERRKRLLASCASVTATSQG
jgi:hypothetical protein